MSARPTREVAQSETDTLELVRRAQAGDLGSFNTLVIRYQDGAYSLALRFLGSPPAAEDVTQEAFIKAFRAIESFRGERFRSWLFSIVANLARDELRRRKRRPQVSIDRTHDDPDMATIEPEDPNPSPEAALLSGELRDTLERALMQLPEEWRLVVVLSDVHGLSYDEIADTLALRLGTVKSRLSRARGRMRDLLRATGELPGGPERHRAGR